RLESVGFGGGVLRLGLGRGGGGVRFPVVVTPSGAKRGQRVSVEALLGSGDSVEGGGGEGVAYGLVMHALFERVGFLDEAAAPSGGGDWLGVAEAAWGRFGLRGVEAGEVASRFGAMLEREDVRRALGRRGSVGGEDAVELWRERRFAALVEGRLVKGVFDRVVLAGNGSARVLDLKTDRVGSGEELVERYRPQMAMYRSALGVMLGVEEARVSVALLAMGLEGGAVVEVGFD
ncbi:MAG: PD-(D/E)XK nuclease family protein, partial [Planctomycetota bacterium]